MKYVSMSERPPVIPPLVEEAARLLRALGHPRRLLILCALHERGEASAGQLAESLQMGFSSLSQHLACMHEERLLSRRRDGRHQFYRIAATPNGKLGALVSDICSSDVAGEGSRERGADGAQASVVQCVIGTALARAGAATPAAADAGGTTWPRIRAAGAIHDLPDASYRPDPAQSPRAVFSLGRAAPAAERMHPGLMRVARAVNLYAGAGVPARQLQLMLVVQGDAVDALLDDDGYRQRHGVANPNAPLVAELTGAGVEVAVCGQTLAQRRYAPELLLPSVQLALSALTATIELQGRGYALVML